MRTVSGRKILGTAELAAAMEISKWQARRLCETGVIPAVKVGGRWRIDERMAVEATERFAGIVDEMRMGNK